LVLVYRPGGCVREKDEVDLTEETTVKATSIEELKDKKIRDNIEDLQL
jgi:hypothetical protein